MTAVRRVLVGPRARFVATCHRSGELRWFRVESVTDARLDFKETFRGADPKVVDAHPRGAARPLTPDLAREVIALAEGALASARMPSETG